MSFKTSAHLIVIDTDIGVLIDRAFRILLNEEQIIRIVSLFL